MGFKSMFRKTVQYLFYPLLLILSWSMYIALRPFFAVEHLFNLVAAVSFSSIAMGKCRTLSSGGFISELVLLFSALDIFRRVAGSICLIFGKVLCIWDHVFGTFFLPANREVERAGVVDQETHLTTYWAVLLHPLRVLFKR